MSKARNVADLGSNDVLETTATGIDVTGTATMDGLTVDGNVSLLGPDGGTVTFDNRDTIVTDLEDIGTINYTVSGDTNLAGATQTIARMEVLADGAVTATTTAAGKFNFYTSSGSSNVLPRMTIDKQGDISFYEDTGTTPKLFWDASAESLGIGTASPSQKLTLSGSSSQYANILSTNNGNVGVLFGDQDRADSGYVIYANSAGYLAFGTGGSAGVSATERMRIDSSGNLLVGTTTNVSTGGFALFPNYDGAGSSTVEIGHTTGTPSSYRYAVFKYGTSVIGSITQSGTTSVAYNTSSDYRLKEDWQPVLNASTRVEALKPVNFAWKADGSRVDGFLAHELAEVIPEAVTGEKDAVDAEGKPVYQGIDQSKIVPLLTASLQEALATIKTFEARLDAAGL